MLLAIDAGNTNIVFALFEGEALKHHWRIRTETARTADEYISWLYPLFTRAELEFSDVEGAVISSVVPEANFNLETLCGDAFGCQPLAASHKTVDIKVNLPRPEEIGADRLVNAAAAVRDYKAPVIVIDFGTATTFDVINARGEYCGGAIAPGVNLSAEALHRAAAKLPKINVAKPAKVVGIDTIGAMQSGLYWGYAGLIEGLLDRITRETGEKPRVIATGGLAGLFAGNIPAIDQVDEDLTLRGLLYIYQNSIAARVSAFARPP
jgi:type III pantothenate kinase